MHTRMQEANHNNKKTGMNHGTCVVENIFAGIRHRHGNVDTIWTKTGFACVANRKITRRFFFQKAGQVETHRCQDQWEGRDTVARLGRMGRKRRRKKERE